MADRSSDSIDPTSTPAERFRRVAARCSARVDEVPADRWDVPAPCEGWVARDVVAHMVEWMPSLLDPAGVAMPPGPSAADDPAGAWHHLADWLQSLLDDPEVAGTSFDRPPLGEMTVAQAIDTVMLGDVVVHTWDIARASGLDETLDPDLVHEMYVGMLPMDEMLRTSGHYGPKVDVPDDADEQTKLIAFTDRRP